MPAGVAAGLGVVGELPDRASTSSTSGSLQSRTAATSTLIVIGLYLVLALEATSTLRARLVGLLCACLFAVYVVVLILPGPRALLRARGPELGVAPAHHLSGPAIAIGFLWLTDDRFIPLRNRPA